jgi:hypothetical protein
MIVVFYSPKGAQYDSQGQVTKEKTPTLVNKKFNPQALKGRNRHTFQIAKR